MPRSLRLIINVGQASCLPERMRDHYNFDYSKAKANRFALTDNHLPLAEAFLRWRIERVTVEKVETEPILDHDYVIGTDHFQEWAELKKRAQPGDELWTFRSPDEYWNQMMGWQGLLLIREGRIVQECITAQ